MSYRARRTTDPVVFARWLAALADQDPAERTVRVTERVRPLLGVPGRWGLRAEICVARTALRRSALLLDVDAGHRLTDAAADVARQAHAAGLSAVRDAVELIETAAAEAGLAADVRLPVSTELLAELPAGLQHPSPAGRRLAAVLAWSRVREAVTA